MAPSNSTVYVMCVTFFPIVIFSYFECLFPQYILALWRGYPTKLIIIYWALTTHQALLAMTGLQDIQPVQSQRAPCLAGLCAWSQRRHWHPTPVLVPGKSHGWRSLEGCSPWGREESDMTEGLHFHFSLSCIGEGNGKPLQCSCLENPTDGEAWWAAVYGVTQLDTTKVT